MYKKAIWREEHEPPYDKVLRYRINGFIYMIYYCFDSGYYQAEQYKDNKLIAVAHKYRRFISEKQFKQHVKQTIKKYLI